MSDPASANRHPILVIMGVAGCGKSTIGSTLATRLGWPYQEGDDFHPPANVAKMRAGKPLDDADRQPWLAAIAGWMDAQMHSRQPAVIGCSALKRAYRDLLRAGHPQVWFVYLRVPRETLQRRVSARQHEYMPASLLDSQLATLEEPARDEPRCITLDAIGNVELTVEAARRALAAHGILPRKETR
jgi:gluconokinase